MKFENIHADEIIIGRNVNIDSSAVIKGVRGKSARIVIGDNTYIGKNVQIFCDDFKIGDYGKIHNNATIHGYKKCVIGHNAWIGQFTIIDCIGGTTIGNNCGIGAHSQLWSHVKYGDTLEGCRFNSEKPMNIGNDVWFVGHCIVSPIQAYDKSMALAGSVVTSDMHFNEIYAGTPAKSISEKVGNQFKHISITEKFNQLSKYLNEYRKDEVMNIKIVNSQIEVDFDDLSTTYFCIEDRKYTKRNSPFEIGFMNFLLPEKAKFIPFE